MTVAPIDRLTLLYHVSQNLNSSLDLDEVLDRAMDEVLVTLARTGLILGVAEDQLYAEGQLALAVGDYLVLYTDGVTEALNDHGEEFGDERLRMLIQAAETYRQPNSYRLSDRPTLALAVPARSLMT